MSTPGSNAVEPVLKEPGDFSLVSGGPLFQLWRRTRLAGDMLQLLRRRVSVLALLAWVPLLPVLLLTLTMLRCRKASSGC